MDNTFFYETWLKGSYMFPLSATKKTNVLRHWRQAEVAEEQPQDDGEDKFFEAYKQEMEKYLSCFADDKKKKKKKKTPTTRKEELDKKPILNIGSIRDQSYKTFYIRKLRMLVMSWDQCYKTFSVRNLRMLVKS